MENRRDRFRSRALSHMRSVATRGTAPSSSWQGGALGYVLEQLPSSVLVYSSSSSQGGAPGYVLDRRPPRPVLLYPSSSSQGGGTGYVLERLPRNAPQFQLERERSRSPSKCKDKGKGKGQPKGPRKGWSMNALTKNSGFKKLDKELFDWILDIDVHEHSLWLVPLAVRQGTNPVYSHAPGQGAVHKQILRDLSHSPDYEGIMAIGSLQVGTMINRQFIYAKVILSTGEEGYINVAMRDLSNTLQPRQWTLYLKVEVVEPTKKMSYWAFEFLKLLDMILSFCDLNPIFQYNQIACCNRASSTAWRRMHTAEVRAKFTWLIKFFKRYGTWYHSHDEYYPEIEGDVLMWALDTADMIGMHPAYEIWDQAS